MGRIELGKSEHGFDFPVYNGKLLSWTLSSTLADEEAGFPELRFMVHAMMQYRPEQLEREHRELIRDSFDKIFGNSARKVLRVLEEEISKS